MALLSTHHAGSSEALLRLGATGVRRVVDTTDPAAPRRTARLDLVPGDEESGYVGGGSMMLDGDTVLVLLDRWVAGTNETGGSPSKGR